MLENSIENCSSGEEIHIVLTKAQTNHIRDIWTNYSYP